MTQPTGSAVMTLKDPGFKTPEGMPPDYPRVEGIGVIKEVDEGDQASAGVRSPSEQRAQGSSQSSRRREDREWVSTSG